MITEPAQNQPNVTEEHRKLASYIGDFHDDAALVDRRASLIATAEVRATEVATKTEREKFDAHTKAVGEFMGELYGLLCDPCADGKMTVLEMRHALLEAASKSADNTAKLALAERHSQLFEWLVQNVKMVYWPKDGSYPIEHNPAALKDGMMWLRQAHDAAMQPEGGL